MQIENSITMENLGVVSGACVGKNDGIINIYQEQLKIPSLISTIVNRLGSLCVSDDEEDLNNMLVFTPDEKLEFNSVIKFKEIIRAYSIYYSICDEALDVFDDSNIGCKGKILQCVQTWYWESKGQMLLELKVSNNSEIDKVRENSDRLIDDVIIRMRQALCGSGNLLNTTVEESELGLTCFTCYCFMKCKILERPL